MIFINLFNSKTLINSSKMAKIPSELKFDSSIPEEQFNKFYDEFFQQKSLKFLKIVKSTHFRCASGCFLEDKTDESCLQKCEDPHTKFFNHIENLFRHHLSSFHPCIESCKKNKEVSFCTNECTSTILANLKKIDADKEFKPFINP